MSASLRQSMDYLHTWTGVLFSVLLFLVFFMGTLSVFDRELDRWMLPEIRVEPVINPSFDRLARPHLERLAPDSKLWTAQYPFDRDPTLRIGWIENGEFRQRLVDARSGQLLPEPGSKGATDFFFRFHYSFHLKWMDVGFWILALVSIAMLALLISGVIVHKRLFAEFFTFRPGKSRPRALLDLHNATSVLLLPFHFVVTLSGLIIFLFIYLDPAVSLVYGREADKMSAEVFDDFRRPKANAPGQLAPVDLMLRQAEQLWGGGAIRRVAVWNPSDRHAQVDLQRRPEDSIGYDTRTLSFDGANGQLLHTKAAPPAMEVHEFFSGLHMMTFRHWGLRWMYFAMGLISCVMIATGLLLWVEKRSLRQEKTGGLSYRVVNAVSLAGCTGLVIATLAMLVANKLLPQQLAERALVEQLIFFAAWTLTLVHSLGRALPRSRAYDPHRAWGEHAALISLLAALAMALNGMMTGDHLLRTLQEGDWALAGVDLVLLLAAVIGAVSARRVLLAGQLPGGTTSATRTLS